MPHRLDHSGYAAGVEDFVEYYPLGRAQFSAGLLDLYPDKPASQANEEVWYTDFLKALV